jgi:hypothetical protein
LAGTAPRLDQPFNRTIVRKGGRPLQPVFDHHTQTWQRNIPMLHAEWDAEVGGVTGPDDIPIPVTSGPDRAQWDRYVLARRAYVAAACAADNRWRKLLAALRGA